VSSLALPASGAPAMSPWAISMQPCIAWPPPFSWHPFPWPSCPVQCAGTCEAPTLPAHGIDILEEVANGALVIVLVAKLFLKPMFNRRSRAAEKLVSIELSQNEAGYLQPRLVREIEPHRLGNYFGLFRSKRDAERALSGIATKNELYNRLPGLEPELDGPCFQRSLGLCKGACEALENVERYNLRVQITFHSLRLKTQPWRGPVGIVEQDYRSGRTDILVVYNMDACGHPA